MHVSRPFLAALTEVCAALAQAIVRDGEGATRFVAIHVNGARDDAQAHAAANTVATSPLVKTALFGGDANWGASWLWGVRAPRWSRCAQPFFIDGGPHTRRVWASYSLCRRARLCPTVKPPSSTLFVQPEIDIRVEPGLGSGSATVWTSDLSYDYVRINGDYRT